MPTGYTAEICEKEVSFRSFALRCARAMGACVMQRDDGLEVLPEEQKPSSFYKVMADEARNELTRLEAMSDFDAQKRVDKEFAERRASRLSAKLRADVIRDRLDRMRQQVVAWQAPTPDHENFRKFMLDQINETIGRDGSSPYPEGPEDDPPSGGEWRIMQIAMLKDAIQRYDDLYRSEVARTQERNEWIRQLYESLPCKP